MAPGVPTFYDFVVAENPRLSFPSGTAQRNLLLAWTKYAGKMERFNSITLSDPGPGKGAGAGHDVGPGQQHPPASGMTKRRRPKERSCF